MHSLALPRRRGEILVAAALALLTSVSLTSCSNPGSMTCDQYAGLSTSERLKVQKELLVAHDLEPNAMGNALGVTQAVNSYCGLNGITDKEPAAKANRNSPLENATNWSATRW